MERRYIKMIFIEVPGLREDLKDKVLSSKYPKRFGNHIEDRVGMINFSVVGRNADQEAREEYSSFDKEVNERTFVCVSVK